MKRLQVSYPALAAATITLVLAAAFAGYWIALRHTGSRPANAYVEMAALKETLKNKEAEIAKLRAELRTDSGGSVRWPSSARPKAEPGCPADFANVPTTTRPADGENSGKSPTEMARQLAALQDTVARLQSENLRLDRDTEHFQALLTSAQQAARTLEEQARAQDERIAALSAAVESANWEARKANRLLEQQQNHLDQIEDLEKSRTVLLGQLARRCGDISGEIRSLLARFDGGRDQPQLTAVDLSRLQELIHSLEEDLQQAGRLSARTERLWRQIRKP